MPLEGMDWQTHLPADLIGSTRLGTLWTRRAGVAALRALDLEACPAYLRGVTIPPWCASALLVPTVAGSGPVGLILLESRAERAFGAALSRAVEGATQVLGTAFATQNARWALEERVKELTCLYEIERVAGRSELPIGDVLALIARVLQRAWQYPEVASVRIRLDDQEVALPAPGASGASVRDAQQAAIRCRGEPRGELEVGYIEERPPAVEGPFLAEERSLLDAVATEIGYMHERRLAVEERARLEEQLQHADRLATIGQLAAGVAHELNEPLGTILGFAQFIAGADDLPGTVGEDADRIVRASLHAREVIRKLLEFGRESTPDRRRVDLGPVVEDGLYFLEARCAKQGIALDRDIRPCFIDADPSQIRQVVVNLVANAVHAMPAGGRLDVGVRAGGGEARLTVSDTGSGIAPEILDDVFRPFFTTKDVGEGTGLGLSVVHGIVTRHGGRVEVASRPGEGTRFTVHMPLADQGPGERHDSRADG